jgi:hypothetical protein
MIKSSGKAEEYRVTKKRTRERFKANSINMSRNGNKGRPNLSTNKNSDAIPHTGFSSRESHNENSESKPEKVKKNTTTNANAKKKGAANFLNREEEEGATGGAARGKRKRSNSRAFVFMLGLIII